MKGFKLYFLERPEGQETTTEFNRILFSSFDENNSPLWTFDEQLEEQENDRYTLTFNFIKNDEIPVDLIKYLRIGRILELELESPDKTVWFVITSIAPEGHPDKIVWAVTAEDYASVVWSKNNIGLELNTFGDEYFLDWLKENGKEKHTVEDIVNYILIKGFLRKRTTPENEGWRVAWSLTKEGEKEGENIKHTQLNIELSNSNTYNALVEVALLINSSIKIDYNQKIINFIPKESFINKKNYQLNPDFNLKDLSLSYNGENLFPILYAIGSEDDLGLSVGLIPELTYKQYSQIEEKSDENIEYPYENNFYDVDSLKGDDPKIIELKEILNHIPYLDTFILNLEYFKETNLLTTDEIKDIFDKIYNDLRRINIKYQQILYTKYSLEGKINEYKQEIENVAELLGAGEEEDYIDLNKRMERMFFQKTGEFYPREGVTASISDIKSWQPVDINFDYYANGRFIFHEISSEEYERYPHEGYTQWGENNNNYVGSNMLHQHDGKYYKTTQMSPVNTNLNKLVLSCSAPDVHYFVDNTWSGQIYYIPYPDYIARFLEPYSDIPDAGNFTPGTYVIQEDYFLQYDNWSYYPFVSRPNVIEIEVDARIIDKDSIYRALLLEHPLWKERTKTEQYFVLKHEDGISNPSHLIVTATKNTAVPKKIFYVRTVGNMSETFWNLKLDFVSFPSVSYWAAEVLHDTYGKINIQFQQGNKTHPFHNREVTEVQINGNLAAINGAETNFDEGYSTYTYIKEGADFRTDIYTFFSILQSYGGVEYIEKIIKEYLETCRELIILKGETEQEKIAKEEQLENTSDENDKKNIEADIAALESELSTIKKAIGEDFALDEYNEISDGTTSFGKYGTIYDFYTRFFQQYVEHITDEDLTLETIKGNEKDRTILAKLKKEIKKKEEFWFNLKSKYGHVLLEGFYEDDVETDSYSLYKKALLSLKDYDYPSEDYSITYIDASDVLGTETNLIEVGDYINISGENLGILHNAKNKIQVTGISRNLRSADDISLTVENVKQNNTLVQKILASLNK